MSATVYIGDRTKIWATVFPSGGYWHFEIEQAGISDLLYQSRFVDGRLNREDSIDQATNLLDHYKKQLGLE